MDRVAMNIHGNTGSHIDALCHISFDGILYNSIGADAVTAARATELDDLVAVCEELNRWSFLCAVAPLRPRAATGSPVNPIAIF
jgi:kynurenine formamidase